MKKLLGMLAFTVITCCCYANGNSPAHPADFQDTMSGKHKMKDCIAMKDGQVIVVKGGQKSKLTQDMTLANGTTVMQDGTIKLANGTTKTLKEGEVIYMDGKMGKMKKEKEKEMR